METDNHGLDSTPKSGLLLDDQAPSFCATLSPYRSLSRTGFFILMAFVAVSCFSSGIMFVVAGAWPVLAFMAFDVLIIWGAFMLNYRSARRFEEIAVWPHNLLVRQVSPAGKVREHCFNPFWTRFAVDRHAEIGITRMFLRGEGRELDIGSFLNPADRESFAAAFSQALAGVRR